MHRRSILCLAAAIFSTAVLAEKVPQPSTLRDLETVGTTNKKEKHQQYDLIIDTSSNEYVCRSKLGEKVKPTEFVVGSPIQFKLSGQNGEATNAVGNRIKCGIVRVAVIPPPQ